MTSLDDFRAARLANRDAIALIDTTISDGPPLVLTHGELLNATINLAARFRKRGLKFGDRIATLLPNGTDLALTYLACLHTGLVVIPINADLPVNTIRFIIEVSRPTVIICHDVHRSHLGEMANSAWIIVGARQFVDLAMSQPDASTPQQDPDTLFSIGFTSGTTGRPKGVCHRAGAILANAIAFNELTNLSSGVRMLHVMPMSYMAGYLNTLLSPLAAGGSVVLAPPFDPTNALRLWRPAMKHDANATWLSPTMAAFLTRMNRNVSVALWVRSHMKFVFVGTAPLHAKIKEGFEQLFGVEMLESYGITEVMFISSNSERFQRKAGSVGRPLSGVRIESRSSHGQSLSVGAESELWIQSPYALAGYLDPKESVPQAPLQNDWFPSGDIGFVDADGDCFVTGRLKDIIIHGGVNVSPRAIEDVLISCPGVRDAAVIGLPHAFWGEEVVAVLLLDEDVADEQIQVAARHLCRSALPPDAVPTRFLVESQFPRTSTGKVQKGQLRDKLLKEAAL